MTELVIGWARGVWGRETLRRKIERLERALTTATGLLRQYHDTNRAQGEEVIRLEAQNAELLAAVKAWEDASARIDPNAKCPVCGACDGFLDHIPQFDKNTKACIDVLCRNNCNVCGAHFISGPPVAGRELAVQLYQPDLAPKVILSGERK